MKFAIGFLMVCWLLVGVGKADAALIWINNVEIESISNEYDGGSHDVLLVQLKSPVNSGCTKNDVLSYWTNVGFSNVIDGRANILIAALAQGVRVDIKVDNAKCSPMYGAWLVGVRLHKP